MIISVDTVRDSPDAMRAAARLILELAGESSRLPPSHPLAPDPLRVEPTREEPLRVGPAPEPRVASQQHPVPEPVTPRPMTPVKEPVPASRSGFEELGLEIYDENEPTPRSVSVTVASRKDEERRSEQKTPEKPVPKLPGGVRIY
jgi:hypothetical protein